MHTLFLEQFFILQVFDRPKIYSCIGSCTAVLE
jgi:hypothetical protein